MSSRFSRIDFFFLSCYSISRDSCSGCCQCFPALWSWTSISAGFPVDLCGSFQQIELWFAGDLRIPWMQMYPRYLCRNARAFNALLGFEYRASAFLLFLLPLAASCAMIKCRKQLRGVTTLLGLEYRGKAAFIFACFQRQTVLYFEQRPSTLCSPNPRIPCGLCRRSLGSSPAICWHRRSLLR